MFTDQTGYLVEIPALPKRIVSLVPSQTELLSDLGLNDELAGITKFCIHPEEIFRSKPRVGGTKNLNLDKIRSLQPDLIIANKEENEREQVEILRKEFPVWTSDIHTLEEALDMIRSVGAITGKETEAHKIAGEIVERFTRFKREVITKPVSAAYLIWKNPYITVGHDTFIHYLMSYCGFINVFGGQSRYPEVTAQELQRVKPQLILLSSEPYPFGEKHMAEFKAVCPEADVRTVDGEMFSWYGSRLLMVPEYLKLFLEKSIK